MAFSPDGSILAAADADGTVVLFDLATGARVGRPLPPPYGPSYAQHEISDINDIAFSPNGKLLATAGNDGSMELWDLARRARISTPLDFGGGSIDVSVTAVAFSPDGRTTASGGNNGKVVLTRVPDGTLLYELATTGGPGHIGLAPIALAFSPDGKTLATATHDGKVRLWDPARARRAALPGSQRPER